VLLGGVVRGEKDVLNLVAHLLAEHPKKTGNDGQSHHMSRGRSQDAPQALRSRRHKVPIRIARRPSAVAGDSPAVPGAT
jgi:hypothetical protein